jgi:O-acetyl-ADP-ribose deacetylase (regulator of RNase III)
VASNHRVETCEECDGEGRFGGAEEPSEPQSNKGITEIPKGSLCDSKAQTWVNAVNCVSIMGKGLAVQFKKRFPEMYRDYVARCAKGEVRPGEPYLFKSQVYPWILNFPTKYHWRERSNLQTIAKGLEYLAGHCQTWGITSIAIPALGCGLGQLEWANVWPLFAKYLSPLKIPVEIYPPRQITYEKRSSTDLERD